MATEDAVMAKHVGLGCLMLTEPDLEPSRRLRADRKGEDAWDLQIGSAEASRNSEDHQKDGRHRGDFRNQDVTGNIAPDVDVCPRRNLTAAVV